MANVPHTMRARPTRALALSFSWNTKYENAMDTMMLSLSMGTTTLTTPFWMA